MQPFPADDASFDLDDPTRLVMLEVILQWARYDALVSQWLLYAYGLSPDGGAILLGNMDTRTKLERIKALYEHHEMKGAVERIAYLQKVHGKLVGVRNAIAHAACGGQSRADSTIVYFAPLKAHKGVVGHMLVESHSLDKMRLTANVAKQIGDQLYEFTAPFLPRQSGRPPEPPELLGKTPPTPEKTRGNKRQSRPPKSQSQ